MKLLICLAVVIAATTLAAADVLDNGNFLFQIKSKALPILKTFDPVYYIRISTVFTTGAYDALAVYHQTALGFYANIPKRPAIERTTRNKNTAIAYATVRILNNMMPSFKQTWNNELTSAGLDPNDFSTNSSTPVGIGNRVAQIVIANRENDGMNQNGDVLGYRYNRRAYEDCLNYQPRNNEFEVNFPNYWQPFKGTDGSGVFTTQIHVCPHYGVVRPYVLGTSVGDFEAPEPFNSKIENRAAYVQQTDEVLQESFTLDDRKKMTAEYFNDKVVSLDNTLEAIIQRLNLDLDQYVYLQMMVRSSLFDTGIVVWKEKIRHDAIRPFSTVPYLYGNTQVKAWGGVGKGPVEDIKGREWRPYLRTPPHTEYPSASAAFCSTLSEIMRTYQNTDVLNYAVTYRSGSSVIEPNITPTSDVTLSFDTYTQFTNLCGLSRLYAGVHFMSAIDEGKILGTRVANVAFDFVTRNFNGLN